MSENIKARLPIITVLIIVLIGGLYLANEAYQKGKHSKPASAELNDMKIETLSEGQGNSAKGGDTVSVHYTGWLTDGTKFDSSIDRGAPFIFTLGAGQVIKGWDQGLIGMKIGEKRKLTLPPAYAYGEAGTPGGPIPPNAILVFEVELLAIN